MRPQKRQTNEKANGAKSGSSFGDNPKELRGAQVLRRMRIRTTFKRWATSIHEQKIGQTCLGFQGSDLSETTNDIGLVPFIHRLKG
jgi:hypothetical protein